MRVLNKKIEYCDDCPYLYQQGSDKYFCNNFRSAQLIVSRSEVVINGSTVQSFVIPKKCPLPMKHNPSQVEELLEFVRDVAGGPHENICPLNHPAYRHKWCNCCEAKKLVDRLKGEINE